MILIRGFVTDVVAPAVMLLGALVASVFVYNTLACIVKTAMFCLEIS